MKQSIKLNDKFEIDLPKLIDSKLLIQANSGGGKSWAVRRILEQSHGKVQHIILDSEGEFATLREKFDYILAGKGGECEASPRSAALLATTLLREKVSAIIDLYELHPQERKRFVRLFLDSLINAPKELWHDCIVVIDEAHTYAPEKGQSEAMDAVIGLAALGRKRGFCAILATQRISKLNKDAAAECNNKLIGRASQDIDMKRAADELGFTSRERLLSLRTLKPGEFYAFGPAISDEVQKVIVGAVLTTHPKAGSRSLTAVVPPTPGIKKILGKLADLPQEAEKEAKTVAELKQEITNLKRAARIPAAPNKEATEQAIARALKEQESRFKKREDDVVRAQAKLAQLVSKFTDDAAKLLVFPTVSVEAPALKIILPSSKSPETFATKNPPTQDSPLTGPEQRILDAIAWMESIGIMEPEQTAVAFLAGYTYGGGGFNNPRGALRTKGMVEYRGNKIALTDTGRSLAHAPETSLTQEELHRRVLDVLPGPEQKLLKVLLEIHPTDISKDELAERVGYAPGSGGFNNPCGRLRTLGLVNYPQPGKVVAQDLLFPT